MIYGQCALGHEGEGRVLSEFLSKYRLDSDEYDNMIEDFGQEYVDDLSENKKKKLYFAHTEHSVRVVKSILEADGLTITPELRNAILSHSSSSVRPTSSLLEQIILIADKISYIISDLQDLKAEKIITEEDVYAILGQDLIKSHTMKENIKKIYELNSEQIKDLVINDILDKYKETGEITGRYADIKKFLGYDKDENLSQEEQMELERVLPELEKEQPNLSALYTMQLVLVKTQIGKEKNNKVKDELSLARFTQLLEYFATRPNKLEEVLQNMSGAGKDGQLHLYTKWKKYSLPLQIAFCMSSFDKDELSYVFSEVEHLLPEEVQPKLNFLIDRESRTRNFN
jgi:dGTP triphosphohydrolase